MFKSNLSELNTKFSQFELSLKSDVYCWYIKTDDSLNEVKRLLKQFKVVNVWLSPEYQFYLKELYLLGAKFVYSGTDLLFFLDKSLIASGVLNPVDLGAMPFDLDIDVFVLHPVVSVKNNQIKALKQCNIESVFLNHGFWSNKVVDYIKQEEDILNIHFHENVSKIRFSEQKKQDKVSSESVLVYSKYIEENINKIKATNIQVVNSLDHFWKQVEDNQYSFIIFESINDQKGLSFLLEQKIRKIQNKAKIMFLTNKTENNEKLFFMKDIDKLNEFLILNSKEIHYALDSFSSYIYSKEKFKACRITKDYLIISTNKFLNPQALSLLTVSNSLIKIYKNKIIGSKYYYWAHLDHLSEENFRNFTRFLDKTNNL